MRPGAATGQAIEAVPEFVASLADVLAELPPAAGTIGVFGEPVAVGAKASMLARLLAVTGRAPYRS